MINLLRTQIAALSLAALCSPAIAQPPCSGFGMSPVDFALEDWSRPPAQAADFSAWADSAGSHLFSSPIEIWPIGPGKVYLIQGANILKLTFNNGSLTGKVVGISAYSAAGDGSNAFFLDSANRILVQPSGDAIVPPYPVSYDIVFGGGAVWILQGDNSGNLYLVRGVYNPAITAKMTFTAGKVGNSNLFLRKLAYDGRFVWAANASGTLYKFDRFTQVGQYKIGPSGAPLSLTFDGYAMWLAMAASNTIYRLRAVDGSALSSVTTQGSPRDIAFDGKYMLVTDNVNSSLSVYRACDAAPMAGYPLPASPERAAFDGVNYWVSSQTHNTVSVR